MHAVWLLGLAALSMVVGAQAQKPAAGIELIVPTAAQGSTDVLARIVADGLSRRGFGEVRVRNMPGRSGTLAAAQVAAAPADGRTLLIATPSSHGIASAFEASMPYDPMAGGAAALAKLGEGGVEVMLPAAILALPRVKAGQLQALAVTGPRRLPSLPDVPAFAELGAPVDVESWYGLMAPAGLPPAQARHMADAVLATLAEPAVDARLAELATERTAETGPAFAKVIVGEVGRWQPLVRELGIRADSKGD